MRLKILPIFKRAIKLLMVFGLMTLCSVTFAQGLQVAGTVSDSETGEALPGVTVLEKGTSNGSITDINGAYSFTVSSSDAKLVFSFVGYSPQEVAVNGQTSVSVQMRIDVQALEEVVVIGYGEQKKSLSTGAISSVKAKELQTVSTGRIDQALQGRTAGVNIKPVSGSPGSSVKIRIRGTGSNGSSDPLFIIDGVRTGASGMDYLSPSDVESIEILKDAASAAIYGAEGANGVVIVTTKKGRANTGTITYSGQIGVQSARPSLMKMMNAQQYQEYMEDAAVTGAPTQADVAGIGEGTNWLDEITEEAPQQSHTLSFSGGTEKSTYFVSGTIFQQDGIIGKGKSQFNRYTARLNSNHKLKDWLSVGENLSYSYIDKSGLAENDEFGGLVASALALDPITPTVYTGSLPDHVQTALAAEYPLRYDENGNLYGISKFVKGEYGNPLARIDMQNGKTVQNKLLGNVFAELKLIDGLKFTTRVGIDAAFQRYHNWNPTFWFSSENLNTLANGSDTWDEWYTWQWENFASYDKTIDKHHFNVLVGTSAQKYTYNNVNGSYSFLFREEDKWAYGDYAPDDTLTYLNSSIETRALRSYYGRLSYDYEGKYLINATLRRDGSSMLADGNQWGTFPSVSLGWVFSNESFFPAGVADVVNYAKIRASWGQNGSLSNLSPGQWRNVIATNVDGYIQYPSSTGSLLQGAAPTALANPSLRWETSEQFDIGLDLRFFNGQLNFGMDYYEKTTKDLITPGAPPLFAGNNLPFVNAGNVLNKGFEFEIGYGNTTAGGFKYDINLNFSTLKNEVTYLDPNYPVINGSNIGTAWPAATKFIEGNPIWYFDGYKTAGIFQNQEEIDAYIAENSLVDYAPVPGDPIVVNTNGDDLINDQDRTMIGSPHPDFFFGANFNLSYKGFDLLVFAQGQFGNEVLMGLNRTDRPTSNKPEFFYTDRWTGDGSTNSWFRPTTTSDFAYSSDLMVFDGSFVKIRQLQLGYTLPLAVTENFNISNLRLYVSLDNFFTFTDYPGMDPEASTSGNNNLGIDRGYYPVPRTVIGGLSLSF